MKSRTWMRMTVLFLFAALAMPVWTAAQDNPSQDTKSKHHQYKLIDLGTFGGPNFFFNFSGSPDSLLNSRGTVTGGADTSIVDPRCFNNPDCFVLHAFKWQEGVVTDLGALPGGSNSQAFWINAHRQIVGFAQNGMIDPLLGIQLIHAVLWREGNIIDLGTFGGDESISQAINDQGQVVGYATLNDKPDPFSFLGAQTHPFMWEKGVLRDLGTLGGPDAFAYLLNESGQIAGVSYTNSTPNPVTGVPTQDPFLWEDGNMQDLGTLWGAFGVANGLNTRGHVVGSSNLAGDLTFHPFSWTKSGGMQDLGTFGGSSGSALSLNDTGEVVGFAYFHGDQLYDAFLWKNGVMTDLGNLGKTSVASAINSKGQVVGNSRLSDGVTFHAFLWENGGPMVDLNTLVPPHPGVQLTGGDIYMNDRGEIVSSGTLQNGDVHAFLLIPDGGCDADCEGRIVASQTRSAATGPNVPAMKQGGESPINSVNHLRNRLTQSYHIPGQAAARSN